MFTSVKWYIGISVRLFNDFSQILKMNGERFPPTHFSIIMLT